MKMIRFPILTLIACLFVWTGAGCVFREEKITIARDGAATIELEISGTEQELSHGDAMPSAASGWAVERKWEKDGDDEKLVLTSTREFGAGAELPRSFATPSDADADLYLEFPTEVRIERRQDADYYFFHRTYTPRRWAYLQYWQDVFFDDDVNALGSKPVEELTFDERRKIIRAFASVEAFKQIEFARAALAESSPDLPVEKALIARQGLLEVYDKYRLIAGEHTPRTFGRGMLAPVDAGADGSEDVDRMFERCDGLGEDERGACYDREAEKLLEEAYDAMVGALQQHVGLRRAELARFEQGYDRAKRYHDITDRLGGQHFETVVTMPGRIVAHNGDDVNVDEEKSTSAVVWRFKGDAFRDRTHELVVVSRVALDDDAKVGRAVDDHDR